MNTEICHGYLRVVEPDEHKHALTMNLLERCTEGFSKPVVFRKMVSFGAHVASRDFLEVATDEKLIWRERIDDSAVAFRSNNGKTDYNYVSGRDGTAGQFLDEIFTHDKDVYAHLGNVSSGFKELHKFPWGVTLFNHVKHEVFKSGWFEIPEWELCGHAFLGNNTQMFAEPASGAPGSDWHMFPTANVFVLVAGRKKWMSYPPRAGDQLSNHEELIFPSGGREGPLEQREFDTIYLEPGDVLFNVPYEWHKVLNARGWSLGAAFRVIDRPYVDRILASRVNRANTKARKLDEEYAHLATSLRVASRDPVRMQMCLNTMEIMLCAAARVPFLS